MALTVDGADSDLAGVVVAEPVEFEDESESDDEELVDAPHRCDRRPTVRRLV